jgi:hypothetical protein
LLLATTRLRYGRRSYGTGAKSLRTARRSGSAGATSKAACTRRATSRGRCTVAMQPRLCATITNRRGRLQHTARERRDPLGAPGIHPVALHDAARAGQAFGPQRLPVAGRRIAPARHDQRHGGLVRAHRHFFV